MAVVVHFDVDAFYVAVERLDDASLVGAPVVVQQFNSGGFVAVSYEAKAAGIRKGDGVGAGGRRNIARLAGRLSLDVAMQRCPELQVKPMRTDRYRAIAAQIKALLVRHVGRAGGIVQKASYDDFYLERYSYGLDSYGLYRYGLYRYGLHRYGLCTHDSYSYDVYGYGDFYLDRYSYGEYSYGVYTHDVHSYGVHGHGLYSYGLDRYGRYGYGL